MSQNEISINPVGRLVMVYPLLTTDPACMQGETGKVIAVVSDSAVKVRFGVDIEASYKNNALATLGSKKSILIQLQQYSGTMPSHEQKMILKVLRLMMEKETERALQYAMNSGVTARYCTTNLQDWMEKKALQKALNKGRAIN